jgi:hypothetical protein
MSGLGAPSDELPPVQEDTPPSLLAADVVME